MRRGPNPVVKQGRAAYRHSAGLESNPYARGTADWRAWQRGWLAERRENERLGG